MVSLLYRSEGGPRTFQGGIRDNSPQANKTKEILEQLEQVNTTVNCFSYFVDSQLCPYLHDWVKHFSAGK